MTTTLPTTPLIITTLRSVPSFVQGYVRDLRLRWACEEAGLPYEVRLVGREDRESSGYRSQQPFGQVPVLQDGELTLFETGAIVLYLAERSEVLLPTKADERARTISWIFAALNSVEPYVQSLVETDIVFANESWAEGRRVVAMQALKKRLDGLSLWLVDREYLMGRFTAADLMMATVLRDLPDGILENFPILSEYQERCLARPSFKKALADQLKLYSK